LLAARRVGGSLPTPPKTVICARRHIDGVVAAIAKDRHVLAVHDDERVVADATEHGDVVPAATIESGRRRQTP
jgi:hypothetical protein